MNKELQCGTKNEETLLDQEFWNERWEREETGWDIGYASPAIEKFFQNFENKEARILIPGCGNAYEAEFLVKQGFKNITLIDLAPNAVALLEEKFKNNPEVRVICEDFFTHHSKYDVMIEQTFFCAIPTLLRNEYVKKSAELLDKGGFIVGLLFNTSFEKQGPPFGGSLAEYQFIFKKHFNIEKMEECKNSILSRKEQELFINLTKK